MIKEIKGDLFDYTQNRFPVHCIAADHAMGAGIAVPIAEKYKLKQAMAAMGTLNWPDCLYLNGVLNLVTKRYSSSKTAIYHGGNAKDSKPTYSSLRSALKICAQVCHDNDIEKLVMPRIGSGLDGLTWNIVRQIIIQELSEFDVLICSLS